MVEYGAECDRRAAWWRRAMAGWGRASSGALGVGQGKGSAAQRSVRDAGVEEEADEAACGGMRQSGMARDVGARGGAGDAAARGNARRWGRGRKPVGC